MVINVVHAGTGKGDGGGSSSTGKLTPAHATALAKLPDVIDWLLSALGCSSEGGRGASWGEGEDQGGEEDGGGGAGGSGRGRGRGGGGGGRGRRQGPIKVKWANERSAAADDDPDEEAGDDNTEEAAGAVAAGEAAAAANGAGAAAASDGGGADGGQPKFLVFAHHRDVMDRLQEAISGYSSTGGSDTGRGTGGTRSPSDMGDERRWGGGRRPGGWRGVEFVRVDGSHDSQERLTAVQRFRSDPNVRVALLSVTAAGVGEYGGWGAGRVTMGWGFHHRRFSIYKLWAR